jgi:hypothetical protein
MPPYGSEGQGRDSWGVRKSLKPRGRSPWVRRARAEIRTRAKGFLQERIALFSAKETNPASFFFQGFSFSGKRKILSFSKVFLSFKKEKAFPQAPVLPLHHLGHSPLIYGNNI